MEKHTTKGHVYGYGGQEMTNNIYVTKNVLSKRFEQVMEYATDEFAAKRVAEYAKVAPNFKLDETELYKVAVIDIESGRVTALEEPVKVKIEELSDQEFIQSQEAKAN